MNFQVAEVLPALTSAVETIMNPKASAFERQRAHQTCEDFKETSPLCIDCGLALCGQQFSPIIRHFGLQLLEHCVKFRWSRIPVDQRDMMKRSCLQLIANGTADILEEELYVKDAVSRVCVELIKHEWPNNWENVLKDLYALCMQGPTQTELVMKVFLRLVEDVVTFQNLQTQRRKEIMIGLTANMADLFELFIKLLDQHSSFPEIKYDPAVVDSREYQAYMKVSNSILVTLSGFLDWVSNIHLFAKNCLLLQMLCLLLGNTNLQLQAAECLLIIVSRKGRVEERKPLLILFSKDAMSTIWNAAVTADQASEGGYNYLFLKRLCQVITEIGKQLCALWGTQDDVGRPASLPTYLEAVLQFTQHPSQVLSSLTQHLWANFLRHEIISRDPVLLRFIPKLLETATKTLNKVGYPSQNNARSCHYAKLDFDSDEDFNLFFSKYRAEVSETVRQATLLCPDVAFSCAAHWLKVVLEKPVNSGEGLENGNCNLSSPSFVEWDALTVFLESVMSKLLVSHQPSDTNITAGKELLRQVLSYETQDPLILSCLLSCISALFIFLKFTPEMLPVVLDKIFSAVVFNEPGQTKATRSKAVKNVRQHACCGLVKICKQYQELIFPVFEQLYHHIQVISGDPEQLSQMEKCILLEALILVSNQFHNFEKQSQFVAELLKPVNEFWLSEEFKSAFWQTDKFMSYVGLDQAPVEPSSADTCGINRSHITFCIYTMLGVLKRCKWPADLEKAKAGGFVLRQQNDNFVMRNPAAAHIMILLKNVLALLKTMNSLWLKKYLAMRHPEFARSNDLIDSEKQVVLGIRPPCVDNMSSPGSKQPIERMQIFLTTAHDMSCHILGNCGQCLGSEFYAIPNLAQSVVESVMDNLDALADYRLRPIIRVFMKPYVQYCPPEYYSTAVLPVLSMICPYMFQRLTAKWQQVTAWQATRSETEEDDPESQEVLEEQIVRQLTREYVDLLGTLCKKKSEVVSDEAMADDTEMVHAPAREAILGELGVLCLSTEAIYPSLVMSVFSGLSWNDTVTCNKCINFCCALLKQLLADNKLTAEAAVHFYSTVLSALQIHGQDEGTQAMLLSLGLGVYELLRPHFFEIHSIMLQIPKCTVQNVSAFDEKLTKLGEKKKKDAYRQLVSEIIGKSVGQQFKREVQYKSLPPLFRIKAKPPSVDEVEKTDIGLCDLFKPDPAMKK